MVGLSAKIGAGMEMVATSLRTVGFQGIEVYVGVVSLVLASLMARWRSFTVRRWISAFGELWIPS